MAQDGAQQDSRFPKAGFPKAGFPEAAFPEGLHEWAPQIRQVASQTVTRVRRPELPPVTGVGWTEEFLVVPSQGQPSPDSRIQDSAALERPAELSPMPAVLAMQDWRQLVEWARPPRAAVPERHPQPVAQALAEQAPVAQPAQVSPTFEPVSKLERERFQARLEADTASASSASSPSVSPSPSPSPSKVLPATASPQKASTPAPARLEDRMSPSLSGPFDPTLLESTVAGAPGGVAHALPANVPAQVLEVERDLHHATGPLRGRNAATTAARAGAPEMRALGVETETAGASPAMPSSPRTPPAVVFESPDPFASETFRTSRSTRSRDFVGREEVSAPPRVGIETLVEIRELYRKGERDKAFQLLEAFLKVYPQHEAASKLYRALRAQRRAQTPSGHIDRAALLQAASDLATPEERALAEKNISRQADEGPSSPSLARGVVPAARTVITSDDTPNGQVPDEDLSSQDTFSVDFIPAPSVAAPVSDPSALQIPEHEYDLMVGPGLMIDSEDTGAKATPPSKVPSAAAAASRPEPATAPRLPFISHLDLSFSEEITDAGGRMSPLHSQAVEPLAFSLAESALAEPGGILGEAEPNPDSEATDPRVRASLLGVQPAWLDASPPELAGDLAGDLEGDLPGDMARNSADSPDAMGAGSPPKAGAHWEAHAALQEESPAAQLPLDAALAFDELKPAAAETPALPPLTDSALMEISLFGEVLSTLSQHGPDAGADASRGLSLESVTTGESPAFQSNPSQSDAAQFDAARSDAAQSDAARSDANEGQWQDELFMSLDSKSGREFSTPSSEDDLSEYKTLQEPVPVPVLSDLSFDFQDEDPLAAPAKATASQESNGGAEAAGAHSPASAREGILEEPSILEPSELEPGAVAREVSSYEEALSALERSADRMGEQGGWGRVAPVTKVQRAVDAVSPTAGGLSADAVLALEVSRLMQTRFVFSLEERLLLCALDGNRTWREATEFRGELSFERAEALLSSLMEEGSVKRIR